MRPKYVNLHKNTFGDTPACLKLVELLNERDIPHNSIGKHLSMFSLILNQLEKTDHRVRYGLARMVFNNYKTLFKTSDEEINSIARNVLATKYKFWQRKNRSQVPYKTRAKANY